MCTQVPVCVGSSTVLSGTAYRSFSLCVRPVHPRLKGALSFAPVSKQYCSDKETRRIENHQFMNLHGHVYGHARVRSMQEPIILLV